MSIFNSCLCYGRQLREPHTRVTVRERERAVCLYVLPTSHSLSLPTLLFSSLLFFHITYSLSTFSSSTNHQHIHLSLYLQQSSSPAFINSHNLTTFSSHILQTTLFSSLHLHPFSFHTFICWPLEEDTPYFLQTFSLGCLFSWKARIFNILH